MLTSGLATKIHQQLRFLTNWLRLSKAHGNPAFWLDKPMICSSNLKANFQKVSCPVMKHKDLSSVLRAVNVSAGWLAAPGSDQPWPLTSSLPLGLGWFGEQRRVDLIWCQSSDGEESGSALCQRSPALQTARHQFLFQNIQTQRLELVHRRHRGQVQQRPAPLLLLRGQTPDQFNVSCQRNIPIVSDLQPTLHFYKHVKVQMSDRVSNQSESSPASLILVSRTHSSL